MIPFGAHLIVERIACDLANWEPDPNAPDDDEGHRDQDGMKDYVRIFLKYVKPSTKCFERPVATDKRKRERKKRADSYSDKLLTVDDIDCKQSGFVEHGMCEVESFLASQKWSREQVDWDLCYE